jgi:hypothetical protein
MNNLTQLGVRNPTRLSIDDQDLFYTGVLQALEKDPFSDHACCAGYDRLDFHGPTARRSNHRSYLIILLISRAAMYPVLGACLGRELTFRRQSQFIAPQPSDLSAAGV